MKLYVIVDSTLPAGAQAAQACHAMRAFAAEHPDQERTWFDGSNNLVILSARDESHLHELLAGAAQCGGVAARFHEEDLGGRLTAIAMMGADRLLSALPLALRDQSRAAA